MPTKQEIIQKLKNVKLVIGNGFDLHCHLHTQYSDFFNQRETVNKAIGAWFSQDSTFFNGYLNSMFRPEKYIFLSFEEVKNLTVWDIYFYLISMDKSVDIKSWKWCDIETKIQRSLSDDYDELIKWPVVFDAMYSSVPKILKKEALAIVCFMFFKHKEKSFRAKKTFYSFLLDELRIFEKEFGLFIHKQHFSV